MHSAMACRYEAGLIHHSPCRFSITLRDSVRITRYKLVRISGMPPPLIAFRYS